MTIDKALSLFNFYNLQIMISQSKVLTFEQGCAYLGFAKSYVYKLTSAGILPFSKPNGKTIFFDREKLEAWMLSNQSISHFEREIEASTIISKKKGGQKL